MASDSEDAHSSQVETPLDCKPKRRSSIFRPNSAEGTLAYDETFPPNYRSELTQENIKWAEAYTNIKSEYLELKNRNHNTAKQVPLVNFADYENYLRKAEDFCCQVNGIAELHQNATNYLNIRRQELGKEVEATSKMIREKLNM